MQFNVVLDNDLRAVCLVELDVFCCENPLHSVYLWRLKQFAYRDVYLMAIEMLS